MNTRQKKQECGLISLLFLGLAMGWFIPPVNAQVHHFSPEQMAHYTPNTPFNRLKVVVSEGWTPLAIEIIAA